MKRINWMYVLISIFIILHSCTVNDIKNNQIYYINCGQAIIDRDRRFFLYSDKDVKRKSFKYTSSINIIEKYLVMRILLFIMCFYIRENLLIEHHSKLLVFNDV